MRTGESGKHQELWLPLLLQLVRCKVLAERKEPASGHWFFPLSHVGEWGTKDRGHCRKLQLIQAYLALLQLSKRLGGQRVE